MPEKLKKEDVLTIPNLLSLFRILLIPFIIWFYCTKENYTVSFLLVVLSGFTDVLDGKIARKYGLISVVGKILDPLADKLTQAALIICLISRYPLMWALIALFIVKELVSAALGYLSVQVSGTVSGAMWYGKVNTVILYAVMVVLILFPQLPLPLVNTLICISAGSLILAFVLYLRFFWHLSRSGLEALKKPVTWQSFSKIIMLCLWFVLVLFCLVYRDRITVDAVVNFLPKNSWFVVPAMLLLFGLKSISVFIYTGILFAASGVMFSLPAALVLNLVGAGIMFLIPYFMGRSAGASGLEKLAEKYPNIALLQGFPKESKFFLSFITRIVGILPIDAVSFYMGCIRAKFPQYLLGSLLGMLASITTFTVMGMSVSDPGSPQFLISLVVEVSINLLSLCAFLLYKRHQRNLQTT